MTELEKMLAGQVYDPSDKEIMGMQAKCMEALWAFNRLAPDAFAEKEKYMKENFADCGSDPFIELPFYANWGGSHLHIGNRFYANFGLTLVDDGHIYIGDNVLLGPNVTIATAAHPLDAGERAKGLQYNRDVFIGDNVWVGAGAIILPGIHIGSGSVIGAGSVVTRDIPPMTVAVGNPCRVIKKLDGSEKGESAAENA